MFTESKLDLTWVSLTEPSARKESGEAHDIQVLQFVAQCIFFDIGELVLVSVGNVWLLSIQSSDGVRLV